MKKTILTVLVLIVSSILVGWSTEQKARGSKGAFLNIDTTEVYAFPLTGTGNLVSPFSANTTWRPPFMSLGRSDGTDIGIFLVYARNFSGGSDTIYVGQVLVEIAYVDSLECIYKGTSRFQAEGSN